MKLLAPSDLIPPLIPIEEPPQLWRLIHQISSYLSVNEQTFLTACAVGLAIPGCIRLYINTRAFYRLIRNRH